MAIGKKIFICTASGLLMMSFLSGCGISEEEYNRVKSNLDTAGTELSHTKLELAQKNAEVEQLEEEYSKSNSDLIETTTELIQALEELMQKDSELIQLESEFNRLQTDHDYLQDSYDGLEENYSDLEVEYSNTLAESLAAPYTAISGREVTSAWSDLNGDLYLWTWPMDTYRAWIEKPKPDDTVRLRYEPTGDVYTLVDFVPFVRSEFFDDVVASLYERSADENAFAREAFNIVTQLTVYSADIGEIPRWPVETLTEAGGDCEDLAILFASLLKAAPYPYEVSLVYMDSDNPTDPQDVNHVIVWVETDDWSTFAETTAIDGWGYYDRVVGWYYEL